MLLLRLKRYYGTPNVTKSYAEIYGDGQLLMQCEAREVGFCDYEDGDPKVRANFYCMQRGEFELGASSTRMNPICMKLRRVHSHRGLLIFCNPEIEYEANSILLGYADKEVHPARRKLKDVAQCRRDLITILYKYAGDEMKIVVTNDEVKIVKEEAGSMLPSYL